MAKTRKKSHKVLWAILAVLLLLSVASWQSNCRLKTENFAFASAALPESFDGFRIVQLSDLHGAHFGADNANLLAAVSAAQPDIIVITGDLIDENTSSAKAYAAYLGECLADMAPTYYVTGNHEWARGTDDVTALKASLEGVGVQVLTNEYTTLSRGNEQIVLAGVDDPNGYADQKEPEVLRDEVLRDEGDCFSILLSHRDAVEDYDALGFSLTLCGHGHGGIVRIPLLNRGILGTDRRLFPKYDGGLYAFDSGSACFVSRGLGNISASLRLFNRPQVAIITLERS